MPYHLLSSSELAPRSYGGDQSAPRYRGTKPAANYRVEVAHSPAEMQSHQFAWESLAARAAEPNVWYEPWMLLPAVEAFGDGVDLRVAFVYRDDSDGRRLCGVFPFELTRHSSRCPCPVLRMWRHTHCFLGAPLIDRDYLAPAWKTILTWSQALRPRPWWLDLSHQPVDGPQYRSLIEAARQAGKPVSVVETVERACLFRNGTFDDHCQAAMSAHFRQELRRKRRRLGEQGWLELRVLDEVSPIDNWIEDFLEIEARGWKGRESTALNSTPAERRFFEQFAVAAFARQRLQLLGLYLDGRPVAMKCNLLAAPGSFSFKIGFDESLAKFSPGVLLELDNLEQFYRPSDIDWMDSCAKPGHFMIGQLWKDRRALHRLLVANGRRGDIALRTRPLLREVRDFLLRKGR